MAGDTKAPMGLREPDAGDWGTQKYFPAVTYFPTPLPKQYRRRWGVSLPCSGWERVGPPR